MAKKKKTITKKELQTKFKPRVLECTDTSIGKVCLFNMLVRDIIEISKETNDNIAKIEKSDFARILFRLVYYFENSLINKDDRPTKYSLTKSDCQNFSDDDLEKLSEIFIKHNSSMTEKGIRQKSSTKEMAIILEVIDLTKQDTESHLEHLFRLFEYKEKADKVRYAGYGSLFSKATANHMKSVSVLGNSLKESVASLSKSIKPVYKEVSPKRIDPSEYMLSHNKMMKEKQENNEKKRLEPFKNLSSKLETMIGVQEKTATYTFEANKTQILMAEELKKSSDETGKTAKTTISLNYIIIVLTTLSLLMASFATYIAYQTSANNEVLKINQAILDSNKETKNEIINLQKMFLNQKIKNTSVPIDVPTLKHTRQ